MAKGAFNFKKMIKATGNEYVYPKGDPRAATEWIDTGSYPLNALISGSIYKGLPDNRSIMIVGEEATGKTFFTMRMCKKAADAGYFILYFDTEGEKDEDIFREFGFKGRGDDYEFLKVKTVEDLRIQAYAAINDYKAYFKGVATEDFKDRSKLLVVVDSLGFLGSKSSEVNLKKGEVKQNLKLTQQLKELFRDLTIDLNVCKVPLVLVNHVYTHMDQYATSSASTEGDKKVSGGSGGRYGASAIIFLQTKQKKEDVKYFSDKDGKEVTRKVATGTFFSAKAMKSRYVRAGSNVDIYIDYSKGISSVFGLQKFCEGSLVEKVNRGGKGTFYKILSEKDENGEHPEVKSYVNYIPNMLDAIDANVQAAFKFGSESYDENGELTMSISDDSDEFDFGGGD